MDIDVVITKEEFENLRDFSYEKFCELTTKLVKLSVEESLKALPSVMTHLSSQSAYLSGLSNKFYTDNKDLDTKQNRSVMAQTIEDMEGKYPGKSYDEILKLAAKRARDTISRINQTPQRDDVDLNQADSHLGKL